MIEKVTNFIREQIDEKGYAVVGVNVELGVNEVEQIVENLRTEGYALQTETDTEHQTIKVTGKRIRGRYPWGK